MTCSWKAGFKMPAPNTIAGAPKLYTFSVIFTVTIRNTRTPPGGIARGC